MPRKQKVSIFSLNISAMDTIYVSVDDNDCNLYYLRMYEERDENFAVFSVFPYHPSYLTVSEHELLLSLFLICTSI